MLAVGMAAVLSSGCSASPEHYPGTDVLQIAGFEFQSAAEVQHSGGALQTGTLVFRGEGDLRKHFRDYLLAMEEEGWKPTYTNVTRQTGTATLRKDRRVAQVEFSVGREKITATIRVVEAPPVELR